MNWLDLFDDDAERNRAIARNHAREVLAGPCDDDVEVTAPYIDFLPEESGKEEGSPLHFVEHISAAEMDRQMQYAFLMGM